MRRLLMLAIIVAVIGSIVAAPVLAKPPSGQSGKSNNATVLLVSKDTTTWEIIWPGPFGELKYDLANPSGLQARLTVHGLLPGEWYMVTFQGEWPEDGFSVTDGLLANSQDLWPASGATSTLGWADIALFQTNNEGDANVVIPTSSGLDPNQNPLWGMNTNPSLTNGTYTGVRVVVKYVGDGAGWFNATRLIYGTDPVLFEYQAMETFKVGP